jgi:hypothetical protein
MPKPERRDPTKEKQWRRMLRLWRRSGLTGRDFCSEQGLSEPSFYAWRRQIAQRDREGVSPTSAAREETRSAAAQRTAAFERHKGSASPAFMKVTIAAATPAIEVVVADRRVLRVRQALTQTFSANWCVCWRSRHAEPISSRARLSVHAADRHA